MAGAFYNPLAKVYYRPIEAAIRWTGLARHEQRILGVLKARLIPEAREFPEWPALKLNTERIYDGIKNKELPHGIDGITVQRRSRISPSHLTVRHVDLKEWMARYYPEQRPDFLFSRFEQQLAPKGISMDSVQALLIERDTLTARVEQAERRIAQLQSENTVLLAARGSSDANTPPMSARAQTTYLHIVGTMLDLLLGTSPSGQPYSTFRTQESVITALVALHGDKLGIAQRTLERQFAAARRQLRDS